MSDEINSKVGKYPENMCITVFTGISRMVIAPS